MAEKLCTLRTKGGGKYTETSLWTNPSSGTLFGGQTVTLSDNISNYKYLKVRYKNNTTVDQVGIIIVDIANFISQSPAPNNYNFPGMLTSNLSYARSFVYASANKIQFGTCYRITNGTANNSYSIPLEILGIE